MDVLSTWLVAFLRHWLSAAVPVHICGGLLLVECALAREQKCHLFCSLISRVKECCCPVIPSPNKSKVLSFKECKIDSEKVLKINDCIPDVLAMDSNDETQKLHPVTWSPLSSRPTEEKIDVHNSSWIYPSENVARDFPPPSMPETHTCFENFAYSSPLEAESDPCQIPETLEAGKTAVMLYQPQCYLDIFHEDAASTTRETGDRKKSLRYISQTDVHCMGGRL